MSFKNKLGRTVSYTVLLAGVLTAGNALGAEYTSNTLKGDVTLEGTENTFTGDLNINNPESTVSLKGDGSLTFGEGNITISGVDEYGDSTQRNSINAAGTWEADLIFDENFGSAKLTDGASIEADNITIKGGNFELSGSNEALSNVPEGKDWVYGTLLGPTGTLTVEGGTVSVSDKAQINAEKINMTGGTINLNGGEALLRTFGDSENIEVGDGEKTAVINVTGDNYISTKGKFNLNKNAELNLNNAILDLVENMPQNAESAELTAQTVTNLAGIIDVNNSTLNGNIELNGKAAVETAMNEVEQGEMTADEFAAAKNQAALAAAPKADFTGANTVNGNITNTYGVIKIADGASLKATGITNGEMGYIDVAGRIESAVDNTNGQVTVKGSNAYIKQLTGGELNISANTSSSKLFGQGKDDASEVEQVYISEGNEFTLDSDKFSSDEYVTYGKLALGMDVKDVAKTKVGRGGALDLGSNTLTSGETALWGGSTLSFNVDQTADTDTKREQEGGKIIGTVKTHLNNGESATINPVIGVDALSGTYQYADSVEKGDGIDPKLNLSQNNMLYNVDFSKDKNILDIEKKGADEVAQEVASAGGDANHAGLINAWVGGNANASALSGEARAMAEHLNTLAQTNPKAAVDAAKALAPEVNPVVDSHVTENARQIFNVAGSRLDSATRGMASGDSMFKKAGMWIQGLLNKSEYDKHDGFDVDSEGVAAGIDGYVTDNVKVGVGYAYTESDIDSVGRKTDADTNTGFIYGEYNAPSYYVNGVASYSKGDYKEKKNVAGKLARASYDVDAIAMQAIAGYKMGNFAPEAGLRYINAQQDAYTDTAGQHVGSNSSDTLTAILGGRYATNIQAGEYTLRPEVKLAATYDLMRDKNSTAVTLANGSGYLVRGENLDRFGIEAGAGFSMAVSDNVKVGLNYEGRFKEDYTDHTGILEARYNF